MKEIMDFHFLMLSLLTLCYFFSTASAQSFCGKIQIQPPFLCSNSTLPCPLGRIILCRSHKLYFRTTLGLFPISSINYTAKTLTISHSSCSSSLHYVSPLLLSAGFPSPPQFNSLFLYNCLNKTKPMPQIVQNCTVFNSCGDPQKQKQDPERLSCLLVEDVEKFNASFHPKDMKCSHYSRVYRGNSEDYYKEYELGTRISFDIPDHVPDMCKECEKADGHCGVGLRCLCQAKECKDKISKGTFINQFGSILLLLLSFIVMMVSA